MVAHARVAPGRAQRAQDDVAPMHEGPGQVDVVSGEPREGHLHSGDVPQQLLDVGPDERGVAGQPNPVTRASQQQQSPHSQGAGRRLETTREQTVRHPGEPAVADVAR